MVTINTLSSNTGDYKGIKLLVLPYRILSFHLHLPITYEFFLVKTPVVYQTLCKNSKSQKAHSDCFASVVLLGWTQQRLVYKLFVARCMYHIKCETSTPSPPQHTHTLLLPSKARLFVGIWPVEGALFRSINVINSYTRATACSTMWTCSFGKCTFYTVISLSTIFTVNASYISKTELCLPVGESNESVLRRIHHVIPFIDNHQKCILSKFFYLDFGIK